MPVSRDEVVRLFGELDDVAVDRIIATGADEAELREAVAWLDGEEEDVEAALGEPSSPRVSKVVNLVMSLREEEEEDVVPGGLP